ncbi:tyrosine-protein phosphatase non-receptor type 7-like [Montipora foliosa]|uniref:tyrosine-protein phosphatase non-receptor type 7-like n=1 Tax=Montipora foliosa TaxID=591990 RepID=UPI0035F18905
MVVRFFEFSWLLWILTSSEARTTFSGTRQAVDNTSTADAGSYGGLATTGFSHAVEAVKPQSTRPKDHLNTSDGGKNVNMYHKRTFSQYKRNQNAFATRSTRVNLSSTGHEDLPELYILVLNIATGLKNFSETSRNHFTSILSKSLHLHDQGCVILHVFPISVKRIQVELYCEKNMAQAMGSEWEPNVFIPADKMIRTLDSPNMQPFLKEFNVTAYGVKNTPEIDLAVYQEMWFPVAVVAGVTVILIFLAIVCLLFCRRHVETKAEEEHSAQQLDPEKLLYPAVDPTNTMSTSMIQPDAGRVYTITGVPPKPRKWQGSNLSLSDRRGSKASLKLDLAPSLTDLTPSSSAPSILESPTEEKLASKSRPLTYNQLEDCVNNSKKLYEEFWEIPMNHPPPEERLPGSSYRNRYPFILPNARTRVNLPEIPGDPLSIYMNANFIKGYQGRKRAHIATQGPLSCTVKDFWRMIWYHHCPIIVMITKLKERNETKCERYWPDPMFKMQEKYGDIVVTFDSAIGRDGYQITSLYISDSQSLEPPRRVYHYWYTAWPDHGVPDSPRQFLRLVEEVHIAQEREDVKEGPVVVHCSAGIGRTGCFIAASIGIEQIKREDLVDILKIVSLMRIDRGGMVEQPVQYELVYNALHHYWTTRTGSEDDDSRDIALEAIFDE